MVYKALLHIACSLLPRCAQVLTDSKSALFQESLNMLNRRSVLATGALAAIPLAAPRRCPSAKPQGCGGAGHDPGTPRPGPTAGAASAIAEIVQYNIFETLTKINPEGSVSPLLAQSWEVSPDLKTYTFKLRKVRQVSERRALQRRCVKFSLCPCWQREKHQQRQGTFANLTTQVVDDTPW